MLTATDAGPGTQPAAIREVAALFLRLGCTAFGGPAAHIALMQSEVVERRRWLTREQFLDLLGAANLLPGPSSTELAIYIGYRRAGWAGLLLAGACFILPAFLITLAMAWAYVRLGHVPRFAGLLAGVKPVVIAVVVQALWNLGKSTVRGTMPAILALATLGGAVAGANPLLLLLAAGAVATAARASRADGRRGIGVVVALVAIIGGLAALPLLTRLSESHADAPTFGAVFLAFVKLGSVVYGSGYVLLAFLHTDLVAQHGWLTQGRLVDAVAVGQVTPGPVFSTATFIGYVLAGPLGAIVATIGIFLPAFALVGLSGPLVSRLRQSPAASAFLSGVNAASLGLMAAVTWELARATLVAPAPVIVAVASAVLLLRYRASSAWLILGGAVVGLAVSVLRG